MRRCKHIGKIGAGHQATFQPRATLENRAFGKVIAWNRNPARTDTLTKIDAEEGLSFQAATLEQGGEQADVMITITWCFAPRFTATHIV